MSQSQAKWPARLSCAPSMTRGRLSPPWLGQRTKQTSAAVTRLFSELGVPCVNQNHRGFLNIENFRLSLDSPPGCSGSSSAHGDPENAIWRQEEQPQDSGCSGRPGLGPPWVFLRVGRSLDECRCRKDSCFLRTVAIGHPEATEPARVWEIKFSV